MKRSSWRTELRDCNPAASRLRISGNGVNPARPELKGHGYGNCFIMGIVRIFAGNGGLFDIFEIRDFRNGICRFFASSRSAVTGKVVPSLRRARGFTPGGYGGHSTPPENSPAASGWIFSHLPLSLSGILSYPRNGSFLVTGLSGEGGGATHRRHGTNLALRGNGCSRSGKGKGKGKNFLNFQSGNPYYNIPG